MLKVKGICTGCGLCSILCPVNCIEMNADSEGFRYPDASKNNCIECGLCSDCCPLNCKQKEGTVKLAFAAKNMNFKTRIESSSGGIFTALAEKFTLEGGVFCAARYDENFVVKHAISDNLEEIAQYRGAKYSQSVVETLFVELKHVLQKGCPVLFVGTPCQVAAFRVFLGDTDYDHLLLVDMICHGVPSPMVWKRYCEERRSLDAEGAHIKHINLRNKDSGWSGYKYSVEFVYRNGKEYKTLHEKDSFMRGFVNDLYLRPSCSECNFKGLNRASDLTIGDFWGIWEKDHEFDDNQGVSALIVNSQKGERFWNAISESFDYKEFEVEDVVEFNPSAMISSNAHPKRNEFFARVRDDEKLIEVIEDCLMPEINGRTGLISRIVRKLGMCK